MHVLTELKLVTQVKHSFSNYSEADMLQYFRQRLDTCEGDTKHKNYLSLCIITQKSQPICRYMTSQKKIRSRKSILLVKSQEVWLFFYLYLLNNYIFFLDTGYGDITYNSRRGILGAVPLYGKISYHLFNVDSNASNTNDIVKRTRKSKWHSQQSNHQSWLIHRNYYTL